MRYLDFAKLEAIDLESFERQKPYPWANPQGLLTPEGFERLHGDLPPVSLLEERFGVERKAGQQPHDRYSLEYENGLPVADSWHAFVRELRSDRYRRAMMRLFRSGRVKMRFHWHYTPAGCSVSPHCDAVREPGSQLFYFNTADDWDPAWGGETLILDDGGRLDPRSAPRFEDFDDVTAAECLGNRSLIFRNDGHSWHGVRDITAPEGRLRRVFIVVFNDDTLLYRLRDRVKGKKVARY